MCESANERKYFSAVSSARVRVRLPLSFTSDGCSYCLCGVLGKCRSLNVSIVGMRCDTSSDWVVCLSF